MNTERKIKALEMALDMVDKFELFSDTEINYSFGTYEDAVSIISGLLKDARMTQSINDLTAEWVDKRPDLSRETIRKNVAKAVRDANKSA